nr:hypothetical protein [uncultured Bacteroides sp.]
MNEHEKRSAYIDSLSVAVSQKRAYDIGSIIKYHMPKMQSNLFTVFKSTRLASALLLASDSLFINKNDDTAKNVGIAQEQKIPK